MISSWFTPFPLTTVTRAVRRPQVIVCAEQLSNHRTCLASHSFVDPTIDMDVICSLFLPVIPPCQTTDIVFLFLVLCLIPNRSEGFMKGYYPAREQSCFISRHTWQHDALLYRSALRTTVSSAGSRFATMFVCLFLFGSLDQG